MSTHTLKSEFKRRRYGLDKLEKKKTSCCPETVSQPGNCVATRKLGRDQKKLCRDQKTWSQPGNCVVARKLGRDQEIFSLPGNLVATQKTIATRKLGRDLKTVSRPKKPCRN